MSPAQELQVQEKRAVEGKNETTAPTRSYLPATDIYETPEALVVIMEMPGVDKEDIEMAIENDALAVSGRIDLGKYQDLMSVYTEYNIGNYRRSFTLSNVVDREKITASHENGVLKLKLPKVAAALPRKIAVS